MPALDLEKQRLDLRRAYFSKLRKGSFITASAPMFGGSMQADGRRMQFKAPAHEPAPAKPLSKAGHVIGSLADFRELTWLG